MEVKLSTIIPVYNAEQFLPRCLDSVLSQNMDDREIICVDDGSTDDSLRILRFYAENHKEIRILEQENRHAGTARNHGLAIARGEYVHFLDADDFLLPDVYDRLYRTAKELDVDCLKFCGKAFSYQDGKASKNQPEDYAASYLDRELIGKVISVRTNGRELIDCSSRVPWLGIYKRSFLEENRIRFNGLRCVNDRSFYVRVILCTEKIAYTDVFAVCHQIENPSSLVGIRMDHFTCHFESYHEIERYLKQSDPILRRRFLSAELYDLFFWYKRLNKEQIRQIRRDMYQFFLTLDWDNLNRLPFMFELMEDANKSLSEYIRAEETDLDGFIKKNRKEKNLYLYGAGVMGNCVARNLKSHDISIKGIIVSNNALSGELEGIPIRKIDEIDFGKKDAVVLLASKSIYHLQMSYELKKKGIQRIYYLSDDLLETIKEKDENTGYYIGNVTDKDIVKK